MQTFIFRLIQWIDRISRFAGVIAGLSVLGIGFFVSYSVLMRYVFNNPPVWVDPISVYLMITGTYFGAVYAMSKSSHIKVDILLERLPFKVRKIVEMTAMLCVLGFALLLFTQSLDMVLEAYASQQKDITVIETPLYIPQSAIPIGTAMMMLAVISQILKLFVEFKGWTTK
jgi:TRAP-type C4-dicarboxylate transport system permease small subunit